MFCHFICFSITSQITLTSVNYYIANKSFKLHLHVSFIFDTKIWAASFLKIVNTVHIFSGFFFFSQLNDYFVHVADDVLWVPMSPDIA